MLVMEMSNKKQQIPAIRFNGFTDAWEQRKLGDLMTITSVKRIHQSDWTSSGVRFLRARDIVSAAKYEEPTDYLYISKEKYNEYSLISGKVTIGDLLVTGVGSIGVPLLITNGEPVYFKDGNVIWFKNNNVIDGNFFYYSFIHHKIQKFIKDVAGIGTVGTYTIDSGKKTPISLPIKKEQEKIGNLFKQFDDTIALHQRQLDNYKQLKKSMIQKIFEQELRFKDADGNDYPKWEKRTLGEISEIIMGQSPNSANYTSNEHDTVLIQGNADLNGGKITPRIYTTQITKTCEAGDIILTVRAPVGDLAIANTRACIGRGVCAIKGDPYIYHYLEMIRDTDGWRKIIQGSTFESINSTDVKDLPIVVPSSEERKKIAI